ncbi:MAG: electron transfer flavoprotein subunit alpha/FixB family protein [Flavobacteriales bacterium]|nr:electron transfer flavoprotein subunit alpha/FixB family protein [Flavobacteriales bacterium]
MAVLVFCDASEGKIAKSALEALSYAAAIPGAGDVIAVTYGSVGDDVLSGLGKYGAAKVLVAKNGNPSDPGSMAKAIEGAANANGVNILVFSHDANGKAVGPMVAARLKAGLAPGAISLPDTASGFVVQCNAFSGKAFASYNISSDKKVISLMPNSYPVTEKGGQATVEELPTDNPRIKVVEVKKSEGTINLPEAELVVSGGRGLKGPENWNIVEELAGTLGAATACSRPVSDMGWRPHHEHVGQTGIAIRPNLYIAIGISGAIQHLAGVNGSKCIVVINKDPEAPFFKAADYGIVGDAFEVIPKLIDAAKKLSAN